ncbi:hypothetical protein CERZMDRAFT_102545 [Cercospora zeae-maydis SCOH1-5]|uniref:non-specific serine/threonine protein kinase n=1 Tax=Cercospora zeae-maydis SCOH1-5 TaxID=717836 RepID=A0A6A6F212_9PEZI|nr:hypothetical protein CERZMDRAFT_102545 [Cercospora zeae-maydis SCOH1-5]
MSFSWTPSWRPKAPALRDSRPTPATPYAPYRAPLPADDGSRAEFLDFAVSSVDHETEEAKEELGQTILKEWNALTSTQRQNLIQQIRKVLNFWDSAKAQVEAINRSGSAAQARPRWDEASRRAAVLGLALDTLKRMWEGYAGRATRFVECLSERKQVAQSLKRDADLRKQDNGSELGSSAAFDAMVDREEALKKARARRQQGVDWAKVGTLARERQRNIKPAGIKAGPLQNPDHTWLSIQDMRGGMGTIQVWAQDDGEGKIADRIVIKDTIMKFSAWENSTSWYGDKEDRIPIEFWAHSKMDTGGRYITHLASSSQAQVDEDRMVYRMWLEYCPNGDLSDLLSRHRSVERRIPIEFIIYTFKALIDCCLRMERGTVGKSAGEWEQIVHRDLKPANILLGLPRVSFPSYPEPKLTDFGLAVVTNPDDEMNPSLYNIGAGTQGFLPPEQVSFMDPTTMKPVDDFKLLAPTNVWGVGSIIFCLLERSGLDFTTQPDYMPGGCWKYEVSETARSMYSSHTDLVDMVDRCMAYEPAERPTPEELRNWIRKKIASDPWLSVESWGGDHPMAYGRLIEPKNHVHYIGMSFREVFGLPPGAPYTGVGAGGPTSRYRGHLGS